jgi:NitT/TauT family transport system ATP-binding protein
MRTDDAGMVAESVDESRSGLRTVRAGFIPLVDCAILAVAAEKGFARTQGIDLQLHKETSWANVRDRLTLKHFDCAHLLAGIPIAANLHLGNARARMIAPFSLGLNGNAITVSARLWQRMAEAGDLDGSEGPRAMGSALARVVAADRAADRPVLTFGMVHPFSAHNYELRYWLAASGIHPDRDVRLVVIPPPYMPRYMEDGHVDGFCVGEPWNSLAVAAGLGRIVVTKAALWRLSPEKILGARAEWAVEEPALLAALIRALKYAARWADNPANRPELAALLARPAYVGAPEALIAGILAGRIALAAGEAPRVVDNYIVFNAAAATFPWRSHALWFYSQMVRWGQIAPSPEHEAAAADTFRPDLYRRALAGLDVTLPGANAKVEGAMTGVTPAGSSSGRLYLGPDGFFDGRVFDPDRVDAYIAGFDIATPQARR